MVAPFHMITAHCSPGMRPLVPLVRLGRHVPYDRALGVQRALQSKVIGLRKQGVPQPGAVVLLEHPPVYTLGRGSKEEFILDKTVSVVRTERGGEVTFHGPGQLVGYLVLDLEFFKKDLHWLVRQVEESIINALKLYDISGSRVEGKSGVWVGKSKVCAVGLGAKAWVTIHGFALNVEQRILDGFQRIVPCGIDRDLGQVTSIETLRRLENKDPVPFDMVSADCVKPFEDAFNMTLKADYRPEWLEECLRTKE